MILVHGCGVCLVADWVRAFAPRHESKKGDKKNVKETRSNLTPARINWNERDVIGVAIHRPTGVVRISVNGRSWCGYQLEESLTKRPSVRQSTFITYFLPLQPNDE